MPAPNRSSVRYIVLFAAAVCLVCALLVSGAVVLLRDRQAQNQKVDRLTRVLEVAGLLKDGEQVDQKEVLARFDKHVRPKVISLESGDEAENIDPFTYDQRRAMQDDKTSRPAPPNEARVFRLPKHGLLYQVVEDEKVQKLVLPIQGYGLWSTMYGYIALEEDAQTVAGITFYEHGETPGLGGEIENPRWQSTWKGRKVYDGEGEVKLRVQKGSAEGNPHKIEAISGATITSRGVSNTIALWLGPEGFGKYLDVYRSKRIGHD